VIYAEDIEVYINLISEKKKATRPIIPSVDYTSLLRNKSYRDIIEAHLHVEGRKISANNAKETGISEDDVNKAHYANLEHQNSLLLQRLEHFTSNPENVLLENEGREKSEKINKDIKLLTEMFVSLASTFSDLLTTIPVGNEDEDHPTAGLYGPMGKVLDISLLERFQEIENEYQD
jgi:hypothetical protein